MGPLSPVRVPLGRSVPSKADKLRFIGGEGGRGGWRGGRGGKEGEHSYSTRYGSFTGLNIIIFKTRF